jgi:hypothetical protein
MENKSDDVGGQVKAKGQRHALKGDRVERVCLCCGNLFASAHKFNRVCWSCEDKDIRNRRNEFTRTNLSDYRELLS